MLNYFIVIFVLTMIIHTSETLSYSLRYAGVKINKIAVALSLTGIVVLIGVKVSQDSGVKYIAIGNHMEEFLPYDHYELSLDDVRNNPNEYQIKEVENQYVMFIADEYNEDTWTIRGFDEKGELVADKSYLGDPRYLD